MKHTNHKPGSLLFGSDPFVQTVLGSAKNMETPLHSNVYSQRLDGVIQSPAQVDPFYTQG